MNSKHGFLFYMYFLYFPLVFKRQNNISIENKMLQYHDCKLGSRIHLLILSFPAKVFCLMIICSKCTKKICVSTMGLYLYLYNWIL